MSRLAGLQIPDDEDETPAPAKPSRLAGLQIPDDDEGSAEPDVSFGQERVSPQRLGPDKGFDFSTSGGVPQRLGAMAGQPVGSVAPDPRRQDPMFDPDSAVAGAARAIGGAVPTSGRGLALTSLSIPLLARSPMLRAALGAGGATAGFSRAAGAAAGGGPAGDVTEPLTEGAMGALMAGEAAPEAVTNVRRAASALRAAGGAAGGAALERIPYIGPVAKAGWNAGAADLEKTGALRGALRLKDVPAAARAPEPEAFRAYPPEEGPEPMFRDADAGTIAPPLSVRARMPTQGPDPIPGTTDSSPLRQPLNVRSLVAPQEGPEPMFRDAVPPAPISRRPLVMRPPTQQPGVPGGLQPEEFTPQHDAPPALSYPEPAQQAGELLTPQEAQAPRTPTRVPMYRVPPRSTDEFAGLSSKEFETQNREMRAPLKIRELLERAAPAAPPARSVLAPPPRTVPGPDAGATDENAQQMLDRVLDYRTRVQGPQDLLTKPTPDLTPPPYEAPELDFNDMSGQAARAQEASGPNLLRLVRDELNRRNSLYGRGRR